MARCEQMGRAPGVATPGAVRRRVTVVVSVGAMVIAALGGAEVHGQDGAAFADGSWDGHMVYTASVLFPGDATASGTANGAFDFVMSGGIVTEGTFTFDAAGEGTVPNGHAELVMQAVGGVEGDAAAPVLRADTMSVTGTATASGFQVPIDFTVGAGELTPVPLEVWTATCEQVTGTFVQQVAEAVAAAGGTGTFDGVFIANRAEAAVDESTAAAYEQVVLDADSIKKSVASGGTIDPILLLDVLDRAENLAASMPLNVECRNIQPEYASGFALAVNVVIVDLIQTVIANPDGLSVRALQLVVMAGIRSGILFAGAVEGSQSEQMSVALEAIFLDRLTTAIGPPKDLDAVLTILLTAEQMGWAETIAAAQAAHE